MLKLTSPSTWRLNEIMQIPILITVKLGELFWGWDKKVKNNGNGRKRPVRPCQTQTHGMHVSMS